MTDAFVFSSSLREYSRLRRVIIWLVLSLLAGGLAAAWRNRGGDATDIYIQVSEVLVFRVLALASAIFTTAIVSQEVEQKTIAYLLTRPIDRWRLLLFRYLASVSVVAGLGIIGAIFTSIGAFGGSWSSNPHLYRDFLAIVFGAFAYGALFMLISLLVNRAMMVCLLFAFGWETAIPNLPGEIYYLSVLSYMKGIAQHPSTEASGPMSLLAGALQINLISAGTAMFVLAVVTIVFVAISCLWFSNFEYVPREDAE